MIRIEHQTVLQMQDGFSFYSIPLLLQPSQNHITPQYKVGNQYGKNI